MTLSLNGSQDESSLKQRTFRGSIWTVGGHGADQLLRLVQNLILTRLLFPEHFGLMALVAVVMQFVAMFSDTGIHTCIIQNKRGEDSDFLNTAWTIQIIRGVVLWLVICLFAWPVATWYQQPNLVLMLPVVGLASLLDGFTSTARSTLSRHVLPARAVVVELATRIIVLIFMVACAYRWPSVWVLVCGSLLNSVIKMICSYHLIPGYSNKFAFDPTAARSLFRFGRWIFFSTAFTFILANGDRLILGKLITPAQLGVYVIAAFLCQAILATMSRYSGSILFPVYTRLIEQGTDAAQQHMTAIRKRIFLITLPPLWLLALGGQTLIDLLYDSRYADAGWILQILSIGCIGVIVNDSASPAILASGDSFRQMIYQVSRSILFLTCIAVGAYVDVDSMRGFVIGITAARLLEYPILVWAIRKYRVWLPSLDLTAFSVSAIVIIIGHHLLS